MRPVQSKRVPPVVGVNHYLLRDEDEAETLGPGELAVHRVVLWNVNGVPATFVGRSDAGKPLRYKAEPSHGSTSGTYWALTPAIPLRGISSLQPRHLEAEITHRGSKSHQIRHGVEIVYSVESENIEVFSRLERQSVNLSVRCSRPSSS
jgi:hypothetical protein